MQYLYWKIRKKFKDVLFHIKVFSLLKLNAFNNGKSEVKFSIRVWFEVFKQIFINSFIITLIYLADKHVLELFPYSWFVLWDAVIANNGSLISDLLVAIAGITGVFLGLYCSNMMSIFSTRYANAPKRMVTLYENDLLTNRSIKSISGYLIFVILVLVCSIFGKNIGMIMITICGIKGIKIVVSYSFIGRRSFQLADVYHLTNLAYLEIYKNLKRVTGIRFFSCDINFQNHFRKKVREMISVLREVNNYNIESKEFKYSSMGDFMLNNVVLINDYWRIKENISFNSYWYDEKVVYKKWYSVSDHEISLAIKTGTTIGYSKEKDYHWFENELFDINNQCLCALISTDAFDAMYNYVGNMEILSELAIQSNNLEFYVEHIKKIQDDGLKLIIDNNYEILNLDQEMALIESIVVLYISTILEMLKYVKSIDIEGALKNAVKNKNALDSKSKLKKYYNYDDVQKLFTAIGVECKLEGERITPDWYIEQIIAKHIYDDILNIYFVIDIIVNKHVQSLGETLLSKEKYAGAMIVYSKMSEIKSKLEDLMPIIKDLLKKLQGYQFEKTIIWSDYPSDEFDINFKTNLMELPKKWSKCASLFTLDNWENYNKYPDLLGACYNYLCEYLIESLENFDFELFVSNYNYLWKIALLYQELSRKELMQIKETYRQDSVLAVYSNPIIEFCEISGYAYLYGEITGDNRWKIVIENCFKENINNMKEDNQNICERVVSILNIPNCLRPAIYNRNVIHTSWRQRVEKKIKHMDILKWKQERFMQILDSENKLLQAVIGYNDEFKILHCEAYEIFAIEILNKYLPENKKYVSRSKWEKKYERE